MMSFPITGASRQAESSVQVARAGSSSPEDVQAGASLQDEAGRAEQAVSSETAEDDEGRTVYSDQSSEKKSEVGTAVSKDVSPAGKAVLLPSDTVSSDSTVSASGVAAAPSEMHGGGGTGATPPESPDERPGFFLRRPVFSTVISLIVTLVGALAITVLPVEQYPNLTPPQVEVTATYNGASAEVVAETVASLLESQINGVDNMIYMSSVSSGTGSMTLTVSFAVGTDPDQATIDVNNRVQLAQPQLPQEVQRMGVSVLKKSPAILQIVFLTSPDKRYDTIYLSNYALLNIIDELKRLPGVGDVKNFAAQDYAMRIWLKPDRMSQLGLVPDDIATALRDQNAQFAAGRMGEEPMSPGVGVTWQITTKGRLATPEEFGNVILRTGEDGSILRLKDVAHIELGAQSYGFIGKYNTVESIPLGIFLSPGANALETAEAVRAKMAELEASFPVGVAYSIPYDTTTFVKISIEEVVKTLFEAMILVFCVVFLFLQNWRATLIPCIAVPVSIVGTFAGMYLFDFSINTLTMFGLVLAIGMVVDDAIVVLENVERHMTEEGLSPLHATARAMREVTGPVIAIVLVLCAVFIPVAFTGGMAGKMYQQFAITIAVSVVISGMVALTFTPALCVLLLRPSHARPNALFRKFNAFFENITNGYVDLTKMLLRRAVLAVGLFLIVLAGIGGIFSQVPGGLVPDEDQGYLIGLMTLPDGASLSRTSSVEDIIDRNILNERIVADEMSFSGMDAISGSMKTNAATIFLALIPWDQRKAPGESSFDLARRLYGMGMQLPQGQFVAFNPPPISGMSNTGGFEMWLQDRTGSGSEKLYQVAAKLEAAARMRPELQGVSTSFSVHSPQLYVELDREKARSLGVKVSDVFAVMQSTFGSYYINDFNIYGRTFRVYAQSEADYRARPEDLKDVFVRNAGGDMIPLTSLIRMETKAGPQTVERFNNFQAAKFTGNPASGYSSGQAMTAMEEVAAEVLPQGYSIAWSGTSYQEKLVSSGSGLIFVLALVMVFLILAAQYESWSLPLTVLTAVPFGVFGAIAAIWLRGIANDVYFQVALVTLIGLSAKNAILIVEFAIEKYRLGHMSVMEAAEEAVRLRFRPIVMTSLAFILGCVPLAVSSGAGAASRHAIGTSVIGGMLVATVVAPLFVPFFFRWIMTAATGLTGGRNRND